MNAPTMPQTLQDELEKAIGDEMATSVDHLPPFRAVPSKPASLTEQWAKLRSIDQELRKRLRQERLTINAEFDRLMVATNSDFDQRIEDAVTAIEADRRISVQILVDQTAAKLREHDILARQMER